MANDSFVFDVIVDMSDKQVFDDRAACFSHATISSRIWSPSCLRSAFNVICLSLLDCRRRYSMVTKGWSVSHLAKLSTLASIGPFPYAFHIRQLRTTQYLIARLNTAQHHLVPVHLRFQHLHIGVVRVWRCRKTAEKVTQLFGLGPRKFGDR